MGSYWTFRDFQDGKPRWTANNGNPVVVVPAEEYNGVDAAFIVIEVFSSGKPGTMDDWLGQVRYLYASITDPEDAIKYIEDDEHIYQDIIVWGGNDFMRWALF